MDILDDPLVLSAIVVLALCAVAVAALLIWARRNPPPPDPLADARTPAEAKRHWMIDRLWVGSLFAFGTLLFLVFIIWLGEWSIAVERLRLQILGAIAAAVIFRNVIADLSFSLGGPVGRWKARWGNKELEGDAKDRVDHVYEGGAA